MAGKQARRSREECLERAKSYLEAVRTKKLLDSKDEARLSEIIRTIGALPDPTPSEKKVLNETKSIFVKANIRLVVALANRLSPTPTLRDDLIQEGTIGLMRAVELYDGRKGFRFSTYASWWIRQAIMEALGWLSSDLTLPRNIRQELSAVQRARLELEQRLGREPSEAELSEVTGLSYERLSELIYYGQRVLSLESPTVADGDSDVVLLDTVADTGSGAIEDTIVRSDLQRLIVSAMDVLDEREREILTYRFGLAGLHPHSLEEAAAHFGIPRERIRQIEARAISRLRRSAEVQGIRDVIEEG
jgi:RNA polymerase sigma factor (sigma-70 family)